MSIDLPPLNGFHVFECAARHLSFTRAAKELFVTPAAVSQQIKQLEQNLDFKLFHRLTRQLVLTEEGKRLADEVRTMLVHLEEVILDLKDDEAKGALTVSTIPSFAMKWLIPRLIQFNIKHPEILTHLHTSEKHVDFRADRVDMAIRYGRGNYPGLASTFMMRDQIFPVCSPDLLKGGKKLDSPEQLQNFVLLYDFAQNQLTVLERDWNTWLRAAGVAETITGETISFSGTHMVLEAALAGQGVALGRTSVVQADLESGRLICPFDLRIEAENAYYIVSLKETKDKPKIKAFHDWLLAEASLQNGMAQYHKY